MKRRETIVKVVDGKGKKRRRKRGKEKENAEIGWEGNGRGGKQRKGKE